MSEYQYYEFKAIDNALSEKQKEKLLIIRKTTMGGIMKLKPQSLKLEKKLRMLIRQGKNSQKLYPMIDKLSKLKAEATKIHIDCLYNTKKILTKEQLIFLIK